MTNLDIYWSFRSPYSWLAVDRLADIVRDYDLAMRFCFVRPLAMREPGFFERNRPQWLPYLFRDVMRESARLGVPFFPPRPDPITMDLGTGKVAAEQPLMDMLMRLGLAAEESGGAGLAFARAMARRIWGGTEDWPERTHMEDAAREAGLSLSALDAYAAANEQALGARLSANEAGQLVHHWGVPLMVLDEEPFFGQDRLDSLVWRLDQKGLRRA
ncbi:MAG TPA: disulfide bond formation protein DsbA [Parvularcula sp.]|nr:disulfide bond formation protein DsbA [Parvularcula sp.]